MKANTSHPLSGLIMLFGLFCMLTAQPGLGDTAGTSRDCDEACLRAVLADVKANLLAKKPIALAANAEVRENMVTKMPEASAWKGVSSIESGMDFFDAVSGNIISRNGVKMQDGKPGYLSIRLQVSEGKITQVEFSSDTESANSAYVWSIPAMFSAEIPQQKRMTRAAMHALIGRYFQSLTDHIGIREDFDDQRCNRYHSGNQITNVQMNSVENQGPRTCFTSIDGPKSWGPAVEQRFPVIDPVHGIVVGQCLLLYANQVMYVSEIFKIEEGRIVNIDNIGIVKPGREHTSGFGTTH